MVKLSVKSAAILVVIASLTLLAIGRSIAVAETTNLAPMVCSNFGPGKLAWNEKPTEFRHPILHASAKLPGPGIYETRPYACMLKVPGPMPDDCMAKGPGATHDRGIIHGHLQSQIPGPAPTTKQAAPANPARKNLPWYYYLTNDLGRAQSPAPAQNLESPAPPQDNK
jgi:hypothetical protein